MKAKRLHMIGNAHIDPVWMWQWPEGFAEVKATFRSALDRMQEFPAFTFSCSSAAHYAWVEENDPDMFAEIRQRVAEGRWEVVGGWWVEPDCNHPSGESFVRQGLYGQRWFQAKLGVKARVGYCPDSFGHTGMLPQILKKSGMDYYVFMRPLPHMKGLPGRLFHWESDDGSRVLAYRIPFEYLTQAAAFDSHARRVAAEIKAPQTELMCFYGVGNHGGGPTIENIKCIERLDADPAFPSMAFSTTERFFTEMESSGLTFPVVHSDLQHVASGTYAAHSGVKRWNRQAENLLVAAEKWCAVAGGPYPDDFTRAWQNVLFNQFHDILAGTSIEPAYDDARNTYGEAMAIGRRNLNNALQSLSWKIDIAPAEGMKPVVVFNPLTWPVKQVVELEFGRLKETDILVDEQGRRVPVQVVRSHATVNGWRSRLSFVADLPALGYRTYRVLPQPGATVIPPMAATDTVLENGRFRLEIDPETGYARSLLDKQLNFELFRGAAARPEVLHDPTDTWSHGETIFHQVVGAFKARRVRLIEHGPVKSVIRVESEYGKSILMQDFTMYQELNRIDVHVTVDWREQFKVLKLRFPTNLHFPKVTYETAYGHIERAANGEEDPGQNWLDLSGTIKESNVPYGLSLLNDGKYSFSVKEKELSLTVLRSPIYAHHDPYVPSPDGRYVFMDQGLQRFTYALLPHEGGWEQAGTVKRGWELNQPPVPVIETYHAGPLPMVGSYLSVDAENVIVSVVKRHEDSADLILRAYETEKAATHAVIRLPHLGRVIAADFGPCEIKTFRVPVDPERPVVETNLLEE
ncbi:MAG TPA: glycoside hydrolase family 38 C-terminal domain-containing protein [Symbiobacteriaceae bacterium]|nr:glycoside hydrolase family 38 C-terminal domain-containing protein [Symbiobacteriaceae bacterium]